MDSGFSAHDTNQDIDKDDTESNCSETLFNGSDDEDEPDIDVLFEFFQSVMEEKGGNDDLWQFDRNDGDSKIWHMKNFSNALVYITDEDETNYSKEVLLKFRRKLGDAIAETGAADAFCSYFIKALEEMIKSQRKDLIVTATLQHVVTCLGIFSEVSVLLCENLSRNRPFLEKSKQFLAQEGIFDRIHVNEVYETEKPGDFFLELFLDPLLNIVSRDDLIIDLKEVGFTDVLEKFLPKEDPDIWMKILALLAALVMGNKCEVIQLEKERLKELLNLLSEKLEEKTLMEEGCFCPRALAHTIRLLAQNKENKTTLVELGVFEVLLKLGRTKGKEERIESLYTISLLCFDKEHKDKDVNIEEIGIVDLLLDLQGDKDKDIAKAARNALWTLRDELTKSNNTRYRRTGEKYKRTAMENYTNTRGKDPSKTTVEPTAQPSENKKQNPSKVHDASIKDKTSILNEAKAKKHIMISYNKYHRDIMLKIKERISEYGYLVWMDVDDMSGSTLDSMARAVKEAGIVLICMSQMYENSDNCRYEAKYAYKKKKTVIPLCMEAGYQADGWLEMLIEDSLFFDFSGKYEFEMKIKALLKEIDRRFPKSQLSSGDR